MQGEVVVITEASRGSGAAAARAFAQACARGVLLARNAAQIPADWPARARVWMCGPGTDAWPSGDVKKLRDEAVRRAAGLIQ